MIKPTSQLEMISAPDMPGIESRFERLIPWIYDKDRHYFDHLLANHDIDTVLADRVRDPESEIALQNIRLLVYDERIAGGYIAIAGRHLARYREADLIDLARRSGSWACPELRARIQNVYPLLGKVAPNDLYLSKIGVVQSLRGQGLQTLLLQACIHRGRQMGYDGLRIDVDCRHDGLSTLCKTKGFEVQQRACSGDESMAYLNFARSLWMT